jgi:hypothetical protein
MKYLDAILRYFNEEEYTHRQDVAILISDIFEKNPEMNLEEFKRQIKDIKRDFFRINKLDRDTFAETLYVLLSKVIKERPAKLDKLHLARSFISQHFEIEVDTTKFAEERNTILKKFSTLRKPHEAVMIAFNQLLDKIQLSYKINLHGTKEYSGIDIGKIHEGATIGFQIKTRDDNISEHMIRSESSKAEDWKMNGFVLIYARESDRKVESSIQAAYHHFRILNDSGRMWCAIVYPELLAELFRRWAIVI